MNRHCFLVILVIPRDFEIAAARASNPCITATSCRQISGGSFERREGSFYQVSLTLKDQFSSAYATCPRNLLRSIPHTRHRMAQETHVLRGTGKRRRYWETDRVTLRHMRWSNSVLLMLCSVRCHPPCGISLGCMHLSRSLPLCRSISPLHTSACCPFAVPQLDTSRLSRQHACDAGYTRSSSFRIPLQHEDEDLGALGHLWSYRHLLRGSAGIALHPDQTRDRFPRGVKERVFQEIQPHATQLMTDVFGNYVIQKFSRARGTLPQESARRHHEGTGLASEPPHVWLAGWYKRR
ncbi:hypothetical protein MRB53_040742 [Persea americana]|nr:hypothetical protein MRB53_040742 [Persea americana]